MHATLLKPTTATPHCECCGAVNPTTDDGYTTCCNELVCYGDDQIWTNGEKRVTACCSAELDTKLHGAVEGFWLAR